MGGLRVFIEGITVSKFYLYIQHDTEIFGEKYLCSNLSYYSIYAYLNYDYDNFGTIFDTEEGKNRIVISLPRNTYLDVDIDLTKYSSHLNEYEFDVDDPPIFKEPVKEIKIGGFNGSISSLSVRCNTHMEDFDDDY